ncbi:TRAP transporter large permease [Oceanidesulfovibrio marinus]|uniref:C4-dicarboxylate ABC transporter permease n=1 Tax=Oceanidesulfovibrio marinus TaxID=370038 RepID=A0A6P1ZDA3_9BACT|nr:TRAP transporter large permease [Oceanidesulfovibrio marinus]QJT10296.1 TRAP transporter large permease [Oceanidesulfovibrio marinus]TVM32245.1 C4-dicarboxylate ABC transporter permease [Oceanidesulfovibrio marinus]
MTTLVLFVALIVCLLLRVPIGISLGLSAVAAILQSDVVSLRYLAQSMTTGLDSFPLMAVPFFILAGELMGTGGISRRLLGAANAFVGATTGGMALVTILGCMFFAAISGSGPATVAAIGGIMVPEMLRQGYDKRFVCGLIATAGAIGVIIPPSIPMVIYAVAVNTSISDMFIGGIFPGILIGSLLMGWAYIYSRKRGYRCDDQRVPWAKRFAIFWEAKWALLVPVVILGGIYSGVFTPTEAAAIAVIYGLVVGLFVYRDLKLKDIPQILSRSALTTATILIIIGTATAFGRILTINRVPDTLANGISSFSSSPLIVLLLVMLLLLFVGCIMETLAAIIILAPILLPVVMGVQVDVIHFGIMMVTNLAIGFITPPLGVNLFVTCGIADISLDEMAKAILPWIGVMLLAQALIVIFPQITMVLVHLLNAN